MSEDLWFGAKLHKPPNSFRIDRVWAFVSVDADGNEGVLAATIGDTVYPLMGADEARVASLRSLAEGIAKQAGMTVKLLRFDTRTELDTITP